MSQPVDVAAFTRFEREGWERIPDAYHRFFGPLTGPAADPVLDAAGVRAGSRVLDLATGPGYVAGRAAARGADVVGVDLSPAILAVARRLNPNVTFRVADAAALPFEADRFDAVVAGFLLPHLADHDRALIECRRVLAAGGGIALSTWGAPQDVPGFGAFARAVAEVGAPAPASLPAGPPFFAYSDPGALTDLLRRTAFSDVTVTSLELVHRVESVAALWHGVLAGTVRTSAVVTAQPEDVQGSIRDVFERLVAGYQTQRGALELPVTVLIARGVQPAGA